MLNIDRNKFFDGMRKSFMRMRHMTQSQVDGINFLIISMERTDLSPEESAYMWATTAHETAWRFQPIAEYGNPSYFAERYDPVLGSTPERRARAVSMGNTCMGDGEKYKGRGYVQLTWRSNYQRAGNEIGVDLVNQPELAMVPENAFAVMYRGMREGWFTGKRIGDYINNDKWDLTNARRIINGLDKAHEIAMYANRFLRLIN